MVQALQENPHVGEIELLRGRLRQFVAQRKHARNRSFVGHKKLSAFSRQLSACSFKL
jgi:hypothetical protein